MHIDEKRRIDVIGVNQHRTWMEGFCAHYYEKLNYINFLTNLDHLYNCQFLGTHPQLIWLVV